MELIRENLKNFGSLEALEFYEMCKKQRNMKLYGVHFPYEYETRDRIIQQDWLDRPLVDDITRRLDMATKLLHQPFYVPHTADFRGRAYSLSHILTHTGGDHSRGARTETDIERIRAFARIEYNYTESLLCCSSQR